MKKKINEISAVRNLYSPKNDIFRRFKSILETLVSSAEIRSGSEEEKAFYINDKDFEDELREIYESCISSVNVVLGFAGIGKSTSLRYIFKYNSSTTSLLEDHILIAPSSFNSQLVRESTEENNNPETNNTAALILKDIILKTKSNCSFLEKKYPELLSEFLSEEGQENFYNYMMDTSPRVLEYATDSQLSSLSEIENHKLKIKLAEENEPFVYNATKLKYYLSRAKCPCDRVVVIVDDIEPLSYALQRELVMQYCRFYKCLLNVSNRHSEKRYYVHVIISMRPHTFRILQNERDFKSFPVNKHVYKMNVVDFSDLFRRKYEYYIKKVAPEKKDSWREAFDIMMLLVEKFDKRYSTLIKNLAIWNIRDTAELFLQVLENRVWIQKNMKKEDSFTIKERDYVFNNITVQRALACKDKYVFKPDKENVIPNILFYDYRAGKNYSVIIFCIIHCFLLEPWEEYRYGISSKTIASIKSLFFKAFPEMENLDQDIDRALEYLYLCKVLRKSVFDNGKDYDDNEEVCGFNENTKLYLSPRGKEIWDMINSDSVYIELCREDYPRDYSDPLRNPLSSFEFMQRNEQDKLFLEVIVFISELADEESKYLRYAADHGTIREYTLAFGEELFTEAFYRGVRKSIMFSANTDVESIKEADRKIKAKFDEIKSVMPQVTE